MGEHPAELALTKQHWLLSGFGVVTGTSGDEARDEGAKESFAAPPSVVHGSWVRPHCPLPRQGQARRTELGRPSSSMRLST